MNKKRVTQKDIAKLANISESTVSLILNDAVTRISEEKKAEVKRIAKELNYRPNKLAQALSNKNTKTIGLLVPNLENPYFASLAKNIEDNLRDKGYLVFMSSSNDSYRNDVQIISEFVDHYVDGVIICIANETYQFETEFIKFITKLPIPTVFIDRTMETSHSSQVTYNQILGGFKATEYLIKRQCQRIACLTGDLKTYNGLNRYNGYLQAMDHYQIYVDPQLIFRGNFDFDSGYKATEKIIQEKIHFDGIFISNDMMAFGLIKCFNDKGIDINFEIVGYDNLNLPFNMTQNFPSIVQDIPQLTKEAIEMLINSIQNNATERKILEPTLTWDETHI